MSTNTIIVKKNACLSLIAKRLNTTVDALLKLNSDQIKNIDLIRTGQKLIVPTDTKTPIAVVPEKKIPLQEKPTCLATGKDTCSSANVKFIDILYVPAHPQTGKKAWYSITEQAQSALFAEKEILEKSVKCKNKAEKLKNFNKLGILSRFEGKLFEQFMNADNAEQYKILLWEINLYKGKVADDELISFAKKQGLELGDTREEIIDKTYPTYIPAITRADVIKQLHVALLEKLDKQKMQFETNAINAGQSSIGDDGTKFVYEKGYKYFTSEREKQIAEALKRIIIAREGCNFNDTSLVLSNHKDTYSTLNNVLITDLPSYLRNDMRRSTSILLMSFYQNLYKYNSLGYVIKEQCLTLEELVGESKNDLGPVCLKNKKWYLISFSNKVEPFDGVFNNTETNIINQLYIATGQGGKAHNNMSEEDFINTFVNESAQCNWPYYLTLALVKVLDATLNKITSDLVSLSIKGFASILIYKICWIKKVALARILHFKNLALKRASEGNIQHKMFNINIASFNLVWDEEKHRPKKQELSKFVNKAGNNDLQVTECALLSDGKVFYVRTPCWYIPVDSQENSAHGHVKMITDKIEFNPSTSPNEPNNNSFKSALKELKKPTTTICKLEIKGELHDSAFWANSYHYKKGVDPTGINSAYAVEAQAQLMRFTASSDASINLPMTQMSGLSMANNYDVSINLNAQLSLLSGQMSFSLWLPINEKNTKKDANKLKLKDVQGYNLELPYYINSASKEIKREMYNAGYFAILLTATVYGLVAASCQLSTKIAFGPADNEGGIGIKGDSIKPSDPNKYMAANRGATRIANNNSANTNAGVSQQATANINVFAGVEAGGILGAKVYWQPPSTRSETKETKSLKTQPMLMIGSVKGELSASFGVGAGAEFRIGFQNRVFILVASASLVAGPGGSGTFAIEINPTNADRFISCLLGVLKENDFKMLAVFGTRDENGINDDFIILNQLLTLSFVLGLSLCEVLLLPANLWQEYQKETLKAEYAPVIAKRIIDENKLKIMQKWVLSMPPETLANVWLCLLKKQTTLGYEKKSDKKSNVMQASAILLMLKWMSEDTSPRRSQCQYALKAMGVQSERLASLVDNWLNIARFIKEFSSFENKKKFNEYSTSFLNSDLQLLKIRKEYTQRGLLRWKSTYTAYLKTEPKDIKNESNKYITTTKINWSISEIS